MTESDPRLTSEERAYLLHLLKESADQFLAYITGLSEERWNSATGPSRWSVQQIAEHIVLGERAMQRKFAEALAGPPEPEWEEQDLRKTSLLNRALPDRSHKAVAPAPLTPHNQWTPDETIRRFQEVRAGTLRLIADLDQPIKDHAAEHPFAIFGKLNAYQWLLYIPLHNQRHNQQIAEALSTGTTKGAAL